MRVAILAETLYEDLELWYPYYRLREAGADVFVVGSGSAETYQSKHGYPVTVDAEADTVTASQFDGVIIPGGYSPDHMRRHPSMVKLVREAHEQGKVVAAICHAGWMLCSANIVRGKTVTSYRSIKDDMVNAGANWVDREVVRDGTLITSRSPADLPAFMRTTIAALQERAGRPTPERQVALAGLAPACDTLIVGQSGGPTAVINASLAGVVAEARAAGYARVLGMRHGVAGRCCGATLVDLTDARPTTTLERLEAHARGGTRLVPLQAAAGRRRAGRGLLSGRRTSRRVRLHRRQRLGGHQRSRSAEAAGARCGSSACRKRSTTTCR